MFSGVSFPGAFNVTGFPSVSCNTVELVDARFFGGESGFSVRGASLEVELF